MQDHAPSTGRDSEPHAALPPWLLQVLGDSGQAPTIAQLDEWLANERHRYPLDRLVTSAPSPISAGAPVNPCSKCGLAPVPMPSSGAWWMRCACRNMRTHCDLPWRAIMRWNRSQDVSIPDWRECPFYDLAGLTPTEARQTLVEVLEYLMVVNYRNVLLANERLDLNPLQLEMGQGQLEWCRYTIDLCSIESARDDRALRKARHKQLLQQQAEKKAARIAARKAERKAERKATKEKQRSKPVRTRQGPRTARFIPPLERIPSMRGETAWPIPEITFNLPDL